MNTKKTLSLLLCAAIIASLGIFYSVGVTAQDSIVMNTSAYNDMNLIPDKVGTFYYKEKDVASGNLSDLTLGGDFWSGSDGLWLANCPHKVTDVPAGKASMIQWEADAAGTISIVNIGSYGPHAQQTQDDPPTRQTGNMYIYKNGDIDAPIFASEVTATPLTIPANTTEVAAGDVITVEFRAGTANDMPSKIYFELSYTFTPAVVTPVVMNTSAYNDMNLIPDKAGSFYYKEKDVASGNLSDLTLGGDFWSGSAGLWLANCPHKVTDVPAGKASMIQWEADAAGTISIVNIGSYGPHAQETQTDPPTRQTGNMYIYKNGAIDAPIFASEVTANPLTIPANTTEVAAGDVITVEFRAGTANELPSKIYFELSYTFTPSAAQPTAEPTAEPTAQPTAEPTAEPTVTPTTQPTSEPTAEVTAEPTDEAAPQTGDSGLAFPLILAAAGLAAAVVVIRRKSFRLN